MPQGYHEPKDPRTGKAPDHQKAAKKGNNKSGIKPKLELKSIKRFEGIEGGGFNANLYVNGKKTAFVINEGNGGPNYYTVVNDELFALFEKYVESLPEETVDDFGEPFTFQPDDDTVIENILNEIESKKLFNRLKKEMKTHLVVGSSIEDVLKAGSYSSVNLKVALDEFTAEEQRKLISRVKLKKGEKILNTNLKVKVS